MQPCNDVSSRRARVRGWWGTPNESQRGDPSLNLVTSFVWPPADSEARRRVHMWSSYCSARGSILLSYVSTASAHVSTPQQPSKMSAAFNMYTPRRVPGRRNDAIVCYNNCEMYRAD